MAIEEPKYRVLEQSGSFELREYQPMIIAETVVPGSMDDAGSTGFRVIASFIFGNNKAPAGGSSEISMTAPVAMSPGSESTSLASLDSMKSDDGKWRVHFVMPSYHNMDTLPEPNNPAVKLREVPPTRVAVIRFSGLTGEKKVANKTRELMEWMESKGFVPQGEPELARYNPPWTLPFMRRNEVMVRY